MDQSGRKFFTFAEPPNQLVLENGSQLGPITVAYETYGTLSADKGNVVLIEHAFSGDSHVASHVSGSEDAARPGWWEYMVGPGKGIDTDKYFVILSDANSSSSKLVDLFCHTFIEGSCTILYESSLVTPFSTSFNKTF